MTQTLILVRHGVTRWNREGRFQGHRDPPLDEAGQRQARLLAERLATEQAPARPVRIVSSPLVRAAATATAIADALGAASVGDGPRLGLDPRLMEIGQGRWEGRTHAELARDEARRYAAWRNRSGSRVPPGGETIAAALARVDAMLAELPAGDEWPVCLVSHGGTLRLMARRLLGLAARRAWAMDLDNASLSILAREPHESRWRIVRWNDCAHLVGRAPIHVDEFEGEPLAL